MISNAPCQFLQWQGRVACKHSVRPRISVSYGQFTDGWTARTGSTSAIPGIVNGCGGRRIEGLRDSTCVTVHSPERKVTNFQTRVVVKQCSQPRYTRLVGPLRGAKYHLSTDFYLVYLDRVHATLEPPGSNGPQFCYVSISPQCPDDESISFR